MCPRSNNTEKSLKYTSLPINLALNIHQDQIESIDSSNLNINDHQILDHYLDTLQNNDRIEHLGDNSKADNNPTNTLFGIEMPLDVFSAIYAATVTGGGIMGYAKAGSKPSLIAGLAFGTLLGIGTYMTSVNPNNYYLTLGTSTVLAGVMGKRFVSSGKLMPAGLISLISAMMVVRCVYQMTVKDDSTKGITQ